MEPRFFWGKIVDNIDPDGLNRVKITKEEEDESITEWMPVLTYYGGDDMGLSILPEVDDQVLVATLDDESGLKVVIGSVWSNDSLPPETKENADADLNKDGENSLRFFKSRAGNQLIFDDTDGEEKIQLIAADGKTRIEFCVDEEMLSLLTEHDIAIKSCGVLSIQAEEIEISSEKEVNINTEDYQQKAEKSSKMTADGDFDIKGSGIALN
jgi:uncharacterized protein involved in type VI secretion and phage assembly